MFHIFHTSNFKSRVFVRLFCSYVAIIISIFILCSCAIFIQSSQVSKDRKRQYYELKINELSTALDVQFEEANVILSSIKSSEAFQNLNEQWTDSLSLSGRADLIEQIKLDIYATNNLNIYDAVLWMEDATNIYSSTQVYSVSHALSTECGLHSSIQLSSMNDLLNLDNSETIFKKQWIIYTSECTNVFSNGVIMILFDPNSIVDRIGSLLSEDDNMSLTIGDTVIYEKGKVNKSESFIESSAIGSGISYQLHVDQSNLRTGISRYMTIAILSGLVIIVIFILLAFIFTNHYYEPVEHIEKIIEADHQCEGDRDDFVKIISGLQELIGERNGYREKMITVRPFAQQGVLHGILNGNLEAENVNVMLEKDFMVLQKPYYLLALINIEYIGKIACDKSEYILNRRVLQQIVNQMITADTNIVLYDKDYADTFAIVNSNRADDLEDLYYQLYDKMTRAVACRGFAVTIGVDEVREDISQINEACNNAMKTLKSMSTGGRCAVYFYEKEVEQDRHKYYFPKDAISKVTKALKDHNMESIHTFLQDIMDVNMNKYDISPATVQLLIDEVHFTTIKAIKNVNQLNTVEFNIEKLKKEATLEEVLEYYMAIYQTICNQLNELGDTRKETDDLNRKIIQCIDDHICDCELSLQYLTEQFGVSNKYISIMCKKCLGVTYLQYVQDKRIHKAVSLMETTGQTLEQISRSSGYNSLLTFRRNFKACTGVNPSEYMDRQKLHAQGRGE